MLSIQDFLEVMKSEGVGKSAVKNARITLEQLNEFKPLNDVDSLDIVRFINNIKEVHGYKNSTVNIRKAYIKKYFRYCERDDIVKKLEIRREKHHLNPNDILGPEDINYLLENMQSPLYKAIITFLFESGCRINEALNVRLNDDIQEVNVGYSLTLYGDKTRAHNYVYREMYLIEAAPYIREWLMVRNSDSQYLFPLSSRAVFEWLKNLKDNLKFNKPLNPHAFRHGCATRLVKKGMQESLIRKQLGWSGNSNMISTYVHLANSDLKTYQLMQSGQIPEETQMVEIIKPTESLVDKYQAQAAEIESLKKAFEQQQEAITSILNLHSKYK